MRKQLDARSMQLIVEQYLHNTLRIADVEITDTSSAYVQWYGSGSQARWRFPDGKFHMGLPVSQATYLEMMPFGEEHYDVRNHFRFAIGLLFHETGHLISGEPIIDAPEGKKTIANIINDANEDSILPMRWLGATRYINYVNRMALAKRDGIDFHQTDTDPTQQLQTLLDAMTMYRPFLYIPELGNEFEHKYTSFPDDHPLHHVVEQVKPMLRLARRFRSYDITQMYKQRTKMIDKTYDILKDWFDQQSPDLDTDAEGDPFEEAMKQLEEQGHTQPLSETFNNGEEDDGSNGDDATTQKVLEQAQVTPENTSDDSSDAENVDSDFNRALRQAAVAAKKHKQQREEKIQSSIEGEDRRFERQMKQIFPDGGPDSSKQSSPRTEIDPHVRPWQVDMGLAHQFSREMDRLITDRALARLAPSVVGKKFNASRYYEVQTKKESLEKPMLMKEKLRYKQDPVDAELIMVFDRSYSMKEASFDQTTTRCNVCRDVMSTVTMAALRKRNILTGAYAFNKQVTKIYTSTDRLSKDSVLRRIHSGLSPTGGTELPAGYRTGIKHLETSRATRKILFILTDGDIRGRTYDPEDLYWYAKQHDIITIGIAVGTDNEGEEYGSRVFDDFVLLHDITDLPAQFRNLTLNYI